MDGNPATSWSPDPADGIENAYIELDLGRLVTASEIVITFDKAAPPFEFFTILLSSGEQFFYQRLGARRRHFSLQSLQGDWLQ